MWTIFYENKKDDIYIVVECETLKFALEQYEQINNEHKDGKLGMLRMPYIAKSTLRNREKRRKKK